MLQSAFSDSAHKHSIAHPKLDSLIEHLWAFASIGSPDEFVKRFLATHRAGSFAFADIYSPDESSGWSLWTEYDFMPDLRGKFLPFANNGCGDYYGFVIVDGVCADAVSWADHETDYSIIPSDYSDFNDFLALVALNS